MDAYEALGHRLIAELSIGAHELVALVGGGGKTTIMLALGRARPNAVLTTTTMVGANQVPSGFVSSGARDGKLIGLTPEAVDAMFDDHGHAHCCVVVEADGAKHRGVKAPASHEPVIPSRTTLVIAVMGADTIDRVIEDVAHRPMLVAATVGCGPYDRLTPERVAVLHRSERGMRKGVPSTARFVVALTRIGPAEEALAAAVADALAPAIICVKIPFDADLARPLDETRRAE